MSTREGIPLTEVGFATRDPILQQPGPSIGWNTGASFESPPPYNPYYNNQEQVITAQPSIGFIGQDVPLENQVPVDCVPGLEYLAVIDQLLVCQQIEILEILTGFETKNKYQVKNSMGQPVFFAAEDSGCCARFCCGTLRPLDMVILDAYQRKVLNFNRPLKCQSCCFPCCLQEMEVTSPLTGEVIGIIEQNWGLVRPRLSIKTPQGETVLKVRGPLMTCSCCCGDVVFNILTPKGDETVGTITKQWSGFCKEAFTDADNFNITFPADLDVKVKATLLAALFLIDYMYYESSGQQSGTNSGAADMACIFLSCLT